MRQQRRRNTAAALFVPVAILTGALFAAGGCQHSLFKRGVHRSQFETYDTIRNRHAPDSFEDEFRSRRINLRGRLLND
ncbi:MAG: hypothetical protein H6809_01545 [Phycisphaeraceae bacterium]|nr:hypothetical protein [Phycisphaeraceae bacterium]